MTQFLRTFLAIELPDSIKKEIECHIRPYKDLTRSMIKWVNRENLHITLKFLGKFDRSHVQNLKTSLTDNLKIIPIFKIHFNRMGSFPNLHKPKVIWLGFNYPGNLNQIYRQIEDSVVNLGYEADDRPFSPHLTIGRVRRDISIADFKDIGQNLISADLNFQAEFIAERVTFFQSELTREGPIYTKLFEINLASNPSLC